MPEMLQHLLIYVPSFMLHVVRTSAFVYLLPGLNQGSDTRWLKLVLGVAFGAIFWWVGERKVIVPGGLVGLVGLGAKELAIGLAIGFAVQLVTSILTTAGEIVAQEMGFTMAQVTDPITGASTQVVSQFLQLIAILTLFVLDLHHDFLRALGAAFDAVPVSAGFDIAVLHLRLGSLVVYAIEAGVRFALPVLTVMLVLTATLSVLSRAVPNINLMEFSFAIRILIALGMSLLLITEGMPTLVENIRVMLDATMGLFQPR